MPSQATQWVPQTCSKCRVLIYFCTEQFLNALFARNTGAEHQVRSRREKNLNDVEDFCIENGSSQRQNLAVTGLIVPSSLDSGLQVQSRSEGDLPLLHYSQA